MPTSPTNIVVGKPAIPDAPVVTPQTRSARASQVISCAPWRKCGDGFSFLLDWQYTIRGYSILQTVSFNDPALQRDIVDSLDSRFSYGGQGARCFEPGIAIRFGDGADAVDAFICLHCGYVYFYRGDMHGRLTLSKFGIHRIKALYSRMFPGHDVDIDDNDTEKVRQWRSEEWNRRMMEGVPTSAPTTAP